MLNLAITVVTEMFGTKQNLVSQVMKNYPCFIYAVRIQIDSLRRSDSSILNKRARLIMFWIRLDGVLLNGSISNETIKFY